MAQIWCTVMDKLQYLLYKKQELAPNGILPDGLGALLNEAGRRGVIAAGAIGQTLPGFMKLHGILPEATLTLAATDQTLLELCGLPAATIGYPMACYPSEGLYGADIIAEDFRGVDVSFLERVYQRTQGIPWRVIETKRCYLREMELSDLPRLYELYQDSRFSRYLEPLHPWEEEVKITRAYIEYMYRFYGFGMWLVKDRVTDELIGRAGFSLLEWHGQPVLEMGYAIAPARQRQGYATEVCRGLLGYAKKEGLGYEKVYCFVSRGNLGSIGLLGKLGFAYCGECMRDKRHVEIFVKEV